MVKKEKGKRPASGKAKGSAKPGAKPKTEEPEHPPESAEDFEHTLRRLVARRDGGS